MQVDSKFKIIDITAMPRIEAEKMLNVCLLRKKKGYSQFELSFLMGQRDFYVRDAEDLSHTLIYSVPFNNIFREIFDCDIRAIVPDLTSANYTIQISKVNDHSGNMVYKAEKVFDDGHTEFLGMLTAEPKNLLLESQSKISEQAVKDWVIAQFATGYFHDAKNALQILRDCEKGLNGPIRPLFLAKALKSCNGTKGTSKLIRKKDGNGRFGYLQNI